MKRTGMPRKRTWQDPRVVYRAKRYTEAREAIYARSGAICEFPSCGKRISLEGMNAHHRQLRSGGGVDCPCNLMALCAFCHHEKVHGHPEAARAAGWIVSSHEKRGASQVGLAMAGGFKFLTCGALVSVDPTPKMCSMELHTTVERGERQ